jgi:hypothetical protein
MAIEEMCDSITSFVFQYLLGQSNPEELACPLQGSERERLGYKSALQTAFTDFAVDYADLATPLRDSYLKWQKEAAPILGSYFQPKSPPHTIDLVTIWMEYLPQPYQRQISKVTPGASYFLRRLENQLQNQPEFSNFFNNPAPKHRIIVPNEPSQTSRASVEVLFLLPNEVSLAQLKEKVPYDQRDTIEQLIASLHQLSHQQKLVSEWKQLHHMFHTLEAALVVLVEVISPNIKFVRTQWQMAVLPRLADIEDFATNELRFIGPPLKHLDGKIKGPAWITELFAMRQAFEESLREKNADEIDDLSRSLYARCHFHLEQIDNHLCHAITLLDQLTIQVLGSRSDDAVRPWSDSETA